MKTSIIYFGIALVSLSSVCNASNSIVRQKSVLNHFPHKNFERTQKNNPTITEDNVFNPETIIPMNYANTIEQIITVNKSIIEDKANVNEELVYFEKPIEEIIMADNQLIESNIDNQVEPIYIEKSIEEIIIADNQLTEGNISKEVYFLDFEKINKQSNSLKHINNKKLIGMK